MVAGEQGGAAAQTVHHPSAPALFALLACEEDHELITRLYWGLFAPLREDLSPIGQILSRPNLLDKRGMPLLGTRVTLKIELYTDTSH